MRSIHLRKTANILALIILLLSIGLGIFHAESQKLSTSTTNTSSDPSTEAIAPTAIAKIPQIYTGADTDTIKTTPASTQNRSNANPTAITISGRTTPIFTTNSLGTNPASRVALYDGQFLFAHSSGAFSALATASTFQIIRGSTVENYKIVKTALYCDYSNKDQHGASYNCSNYLEPPLPTLAFGNIANYYDARAFGYDLILMTCAGDYLEGQDATHRLLAYATRI